MGQREFSGPNDAKTVFRYFLLSLVFYLQVALIIQTTVVSGGEDTEGPVIALSHTRVTVSPKDIPPRNTTKISIRLSPEFRSPELGKQFIFFLTSSFYKK